MARWKGCKVAILSARFLAMVCALGSTVGSCSPWTPSSYFPFEIFLNLLITLSFHWHGHTASNSPTNSNHDALRGKCVWRQQKNMKTMHENMRRKTSKEMENAKPGAGMSLTFNSGIFEVKVKLFFTLQCFFEVKRTRSDLQ